MGILSELVERKDLMKYIDARICELDWQSCKENLIKMPEQDRDRFRKTIRTRVKELREFKRVINQHEEKTLAIKYWETRRVWRETRDEWRRSVGQLPPLPEKETLTKCD